MSGRSVQIGHILKPWHLRATYQVKSREVNGLFFSFFLEQRRHKSSFSFSQFFKENIPAIQLLLIKKNSSFQITPKAAAHTSTSEDIGASVLCSVTQKKCCPLLHNPVLFFREYQLCDIKQIYRYNNIHSPQKKKTCRYNGSAQNTHQPECGLRGKDQGRKKNP